MKQNIYINVDGVQMGPYSIIEVNRYLCEDRIFPEDYAWADGMQDWQQLHTLPGVMPPQASQHPQNAVLPVQGVPPPPSVLSAEPALSQGQTFDPTNKDHLIIEAAIREEIKKPHGVLTSQDLYKATALQIIVEEIADITPLAGLKELKELDLSYNKISDLSPLTGLEKLEQLELVDNQITDLTPLGRLWGLKELGLIHNQVTNLTPLEGLASLRKLELEKNPNLNITEVQKLKEALPNCTIDHGNSPFLTLICSVLLLSVVIGVFVLIGYYLLEPNWSTRSQSEREQLVLTIKIVAGIGGPILAWGSYRMLSNIMH